MHQPQPGPLAGVRVIELSTVVMGPLAARILGDLGADVIKVEPPEGDLIRFLEPSRSPGMSGFFLNLNRNKRSIDLDLKDAEDRDSFLSLIAGADVFVTNVRERALVSLGITYDECAGRNPRLIYCSGRGFGSDGPSADKAAYDDVIQAASGLASLFVLQQGEPAYVPSIIADKICALHMVYAVNAALYRLATTGQGDYIEVPMAETMAALNLVEHLGGHAFEPRLGEFGYGRIVSAERKPRRSLDGWVCVMPYTNANWRAFFELSGRADAAADPRFATINSRVEHVTEVYALLDEIVAGRTSAEWLEICARLSIPAAPILDLAEAEDDEHFAAVGLLELVRHPTEGTYRRIKDPVHFAGGTGGLRRHAPMLGEHRAELLDQLSEQARTTTDRPDPASSSSTKETCR